MAHGALERESNITEDNRTGTILELHNPVVSRVYAAIALILLAPWALICSAFAVSMIIQSYPSLWLLVAGAGLAIVALALDLAVVKIWREVLVGRPHIRVGADTLTLSHRNLLRKPLTIPLSQVERVAVDVAFDSGLWDPSGFSLIREENGVEWVASPTETAEELYRGSRFLFPIASHNRFDDPNLLVVLRAPIDLGRIRRRSISGRDLYVQRVSDVRQMKGFFARVKEPEVARDRFLRLGLLGIFGGEHSSLMEPTPEDQVRFSRWSRRQLLARAFSFVFLVATVWRLLDAMFR